MTKVAYVDAPAGCSGDMFLGALVDLGLPLAVLEELVDRLGLEGVEVRAQRVMRGALAATKVDVCRDGAPIEGRDDVHLRHAQGDDVAGHGEHDHGHDHGAHAHGRTLADILHALGEAGDLAQAPYATAAEAYRHLARAEARVHGTTPEAVHFHEVGAADALVDVAGTCVGLHHLGVEAVYVSALPWGSGSVQTQHGRLPLPAPATVLLLEGHPTVPSSETYEQVTPTGAALVKALSTGRRPPAGFVPLRTGYGAGTYDRSSMANVLRIVLGEVPPQAAGTDEVVLLETHLDDVSGQVVAYALEQALAAGALDAWFTAITMKKGRPGVLLSVLAAPGDAAGLEALLFRETPTLGIRRRTMARSVLSRRHVTVATPWGAVRVKVRTTPAGDEATPEYEDCRALAERQGVPLADVQRAAYDAWEDETGA